MMRTGLLVLALLVLCAVSACAKDKKKDTPNDNKPAPIAEYTGPKRRLGVMDMEVKVTTTTTPTPSGGATTTVDVPMPTDFGQGLTEMLTTALVASKRYIVLERKALADIQAEQNLGATPTVDPTSAATPGKLLGAQALIRGAVTEYTYHRSSTGGNVAVIPGISLSHSSAEAAVVLDIRIYDTNTGQILDSVKAEGRAKGSATGVGFDNVSTDANGQPTGFKMSASGFTQTPLGQATRQAIDKAVALINARMEKVTWEGAIAEIDTTDADPKCILYLNAGSDMGLKVGDVFDIFRAGRTITDPQTKVVIGRTLDTRLGACKVISITPGLAIAQPTEGTGFQKADIIRFPAPPTGVPAVTTTTPTANAPATTTPAAEAPKN